MNSKKIKCLVLMSGGLDSQLAVKVLQNAGCEVVGLTFTSPFFGAEKAEAGAKQLGIELIVKDITDIHFPIVKDPPRGHGKNMNPCIDCHGLMFRLAGEIAQEQGIQIVASGEVLGQRPFSQNKQSLHVVEKIAGVDVLRPLSAKLLPETSYEQDGLIDREKLLDLSGRSRKAQIALAEEYGVVDYPAPAGGCLLTDPAYSQRLKKLLERDPEMSPEAARWIRVGRFVPVGEASFAVIGRDQSENEYLKSLESKDVYLIKMQKFVGPTALVSVKKPDQFEDIFSEVAKRVRGYGRDSKNFEGEVEFRVWGAINDQLTMCNVQ